jgi:hypothetical protein
VEKVLHQVDCPVLTVKPEGFVSPVKLKQGFKFVSNSGLLYADNNNQ